MRELKDIIATRNLTVKMMDPDQGLNGYWTDPLTQRHYSIGFYFFDGWEHLSVTGKKIPDWDMMCKFKDMFWNEDEVCVQYHPRKEDYVNVNETTLHIWRPIAQPLPTPPTYMIGPKGTTKDDARDIASAMASVLTPKQQAAFLSARYGDNFNRKERRILDRSDKGK